MEELVRMIRLVSVEDCTQSQHKAGSNVLGGASCGHIIRVLVWIARVM